MLKLWEKAYGESAVLMDYADPPGNPSAEFVLDPVGWLARRPLSIEDHIQVVHGHFKPQKYDLVESAFRFTMLRQPVDNLISIYYYWRSIPLQPNELHKYFLSCDMDIVSFAQLPIMQKLLSETYFGGWDMSRIDFVGRHDRRTEDLSRLAALLDINFEPDVHLNETAVDRFSSERRRMSEDRKLVARLTDLLADDIRFYEKHTSAA